ncbi:MAG: cytochrome-c peroxidase, partial [Vicinamibacterales bacterium]
MRVATLIITTVLPGALALALTSPFQRFTNTLTVVHAAAFNQDDDHDRILNRELSAMLSAATFTGRIEQEFDRRIRKNLGRPINPKLADLGRLLWFDKLQALGRDNACAGCHSPTNGMGDSQPIAIGVQNNNIVGVHRTGPRNQRRAPSVVNTALYPNVMWNSRFAAVAGDPFDSSLGFSLPAFPVPEDAAQPSKPVRFSPSQSILHNVTHLLQAHAHIPPTELVEAAGFKGTCPDGVPDPTLGPRFCQFDAGTGPGEPLPPVDSTGLRGEPIREATLAALNGSPAYRQLFRDAFPETGPPEYQPIDFFMFGKAIAEFEFTLVYANAPLDRFARGSVDAMTPSQKRGAVLFFGKGKCVECHR